MWRSPALVLSIVALLAAPAVAQTEPIDWDWKERHRGGRDEQVWGGLARNRDELRRLWKLYDQPGKPPVIGFEKNVAVVAGAIGSSSCPARLYDVRLNRERKRVVVRMYEEDSGTDVCTADVVPRTFSVSIARRDLKPLSAGELKLRPREIEDPGE